MIELKYSELGGEWRSKQKTKDRRREGAHDAPSAIPSRSPSFLSKTPNPRESRGEGGKVPKHRT